MYCKNIHIIYHNKSNFYHFIKISGNVGTIIIIIIIIITVITFIHIVNLVF